MDIHSLRPIAEGPEEKSSVHGSCVRANGSPTVRLTSVCTINITEDDVRSSRDMYSFRAVAERPEEKSSVQGSCVRTNGSPAVRWMSACTTKVTENELISGAGMYSLRAVAERPEEKSSVHGSCVRANGSPIARLTSPCTVNATENGWKGPMNTRSLCPYSPVAERPKEKSSVQGSCVRANGSPAVRLMRACCTENTAMEEQRTTTNEKNYKSEKKEKYKLKRMSTFREREILVMSAARIVYSNDKLYMRRDNLIHFASLDYQVLSVTGKELLQHHKFSINDMVNSNVTVGDALTNQERGHPVIHLFVKNTFDEIPHLDNLEESINALKLLMDTLTLKTASVSMVDNDLEALDWQLIENLFKVTFNDPTYLITVCTGKIVTPVKFERQNIIQEYHDSVVGGHVGTEKLYQRIRECFIWKGMREEIRKYVRTCPSCQANKSSNHKTRMPMRITDTPKTAFDKVQLDIVGPLPITTRKNRYLLTIHCTLTKYSDAIPIPSIDATTVALALAEQFISRFGCPKAIHTDQGSNFMSQVMKRVCQIFKIQTIRSTAFHPESLGSLERAHRVFIEYLKHYCTGRDWDDWIRFSIFSYNNTVRESTRHTPHELVFGSKANMPSEFSNEKVPRTFDDHLDDLFTKITTLQSLAAQNLTNFKEKTKKYYDKNLNPQDFRQNDFVYLLKEPRTSKFDKKWDGPYQIIQVFDDLNAEIAINNHKSKIVHCNKLKLACIRPDPLP